MMPDDCKSVYDLDVTETVVCAGAPTCTHLLLPPRPRAHLSQGATARFSWLYLSRINISSSNCVKACPPGRAAGLPHKLAAGRATKLTLVIAILQSTMMHT